MDTYKTHFGIWGRKQTKLQNVRCGWFGLQESHTLRDTWEQGLSLTITDLLDLDSEYLLNDCLWRWYTEVTSAISLAVVSYSREATLAQWRVYIPACITWLNAWDLLSAQFMFSNLMATGEEVRLQWRLLLCQSESKKEDVPEPGRQMMEFQESLKRSDWEWRARKSFVKDERNLSETGRKKRSRLKHRIICKGKGDDVKKVANVSIFSINENDTYLKNA